MALNLWRRGNVFVAGMLTVGSACFAAPAAASQTPDPAAADADPIACWWRPDRPGIHVGEHFTLTLTCAVAEGARVRTVTDPDRLAAAALDLAPFEVLDGTVHDDLLAPPGRYVQRSYTLRLIGDEFFGQDVDIPSIPITYSVETPGVTGERGREQIYLLPALPVRVLSLVPRDAADIQDWSPDTFADIERRALRANAELAGSGIVFAFAAVFAVGAVVRAIQPRTARTAAEPHAVGAPRLLGGCVREAGRVQAEVDRSGWTPELIGRALTVFRVAGTVALGRQLAQRIVDGEATAQDGEIAIPAAAFGARQVVVSGSATAARVAALPALDDLAEALRVFDATRYSRGNDINPSALDEAFAAGRRALAGLASKHSWQARALDAVARSAARTRGRVWRR